MNRRGSKTFFFSLLFSLSCAAVLYCVVAFFGDVEAEEKTEPAKTEAAKDKAKETTSSIFAEPGIITNREGKWIGSDDLALLPKEFSLVAEVIAPSQQQGSLPIQKELIESLAKEKLEQEGFKIKPFSFSKDQSPLPFLHLLVMLQPIQDKGYAAICMVRLFEEAKPLRVTLEKEVFFQSITWERDSLLIASSETTSSLIQDSMASLLALFVERYRFFKLFERKK